MRPPAFAAASAAATGGKGAAFDPSLVPAKVGSTYTLPAPSGMLPHVPLPQPSGPSMETQPLCGSAYSFAAHIALGGWQRPSPSTIFGAGDVIHVGAALGERVDLACRTLRHRG